jgi:hypothetical protein
MWSIVVVIIVINKLERANRGCKQACRSSGAGTKWHQSDRHNHGQLSG